VGKSFLKTYERRKNTVIAKMKKYFLQQENTYFLTNIQPNVIDEWMGEDREFGKKLANRVHEAVEIKRAKVRENTSGGENSTTRSSYKNVTKSAHSSPTHPILKALLKLDNDLVNQYVKRPEVQFIHDNPVCTEKLYQKRHSPEVGLQFSPNERIGYKSEFESDYPPPALSRMILPKNNGNNNAATGDKEVVGPPTKKKKRWGGGKRD